MFHLSHFQRSTLEQTQTNKIPDTKWPPRIAVSRPILQIRPAFPKPQGQGLVSFNIWLLCIYACETLGHIWKKYPNWIVVGHYWLRQRAASPRHCVQHWLARVRPSDDLQKILKGHVVDKVGRCTFYETGMWWNSLRTMISGFTLCAIPWKRSTAKLRCAPCIEPPQNCNQCGHIFAHPNAIAVAAILHHRQFAFGARYERGRFWRAGVQAKGRILLFAFTTKVSISLVSHKPNPRIPLFGKIRSRVLDYRRYTMASTSIACSGQNEFCICTQNKCWSKCWTQCEHTTSPSQSDMQKGLRVLAGFVRRLDKVAAAASLSNDWASRPVQC